MDTKLKKSRRMRGLVALIAVLLFTICNLCIFPKIGADGEKEFERQKEESKRGDINFQLMNQLCQGSYVLYYENAETDRTYPEEVQHVMQLWAEGFEDYRNSIDYYAVTETKSTKNTSRNLEALLNDGQMAGLRDNYQSYFTMQYDENGELSIENVWSSDGYENEIIKAMLQMSRKISVTEGEGEEEWDHRTDRESGSVIPRNFKVVYAIPKDMDLLSVEEWHLDYWQRMQSYLICGSGVLYVGTLAALVLLAIVLTSNKIWRGTIDYNRKGSWYLMEAAVIGICCLAPQTFTFAELNIHYMEQFGGKGFPEVVMTGRLEQIVKLVEFFAVVGAMYGAWYLCLIFIRPLFTLGLKNYLRQYSLIYLIGTKGIGWCRRRWNKVKYEISHVDFSDKTIKTIRMVVILNFLVLAVLSFFWFFGIFALAAYSLALFFVLKKQYEEIQKNYQSLMRATEHIAQGDLAFEDESDWGVFESFKSEFVKIRKGFSRAVEEEVKSQRMKAELITNVSHDLKTPLTAITTYVELLKSPDLTEEQRAAYIEVLEKKSLRLKVLVEDLFEVSKATSNTIKLDLMEVDVINLLKQVCVEHENRFCDMGLSVKWKLPEERVTLLLDNQKTWRVFENLFLNIEKYAMENSRVYIEVTVEEAEECPVSGGDEAKAYDAAGGRRTMAGRYVSIVLKNISAQEINVSGEEITERFVRGDSSRTTEGSGLGLAIAKSFTEAMKGTLEVTVDGDLFKVVIKWEI